MPKGQPVTPTGAQSDRTRGGESPAGERYLVQARPSRVFRGVSPEEQALIAGAPTKPGNPVEVSGTAMGAARGAARSFWSFGEQPSTRKGAGPNDMDDDEKGH